MYHLPIDFTKYREDIVGALQDFFVIDGVRERMLNLIL